MRVIEHLFQAVRSATVFNPEVQVAPSCILWPDHDRQWEAVISRLQNELPDLLVLGEYSPDKHTGPAIWLRCVIAGKNNDLQLPEGCTPIIYLPGISRQDLRAVENCPDHLKPIAELQYRGVIWSQVNAKDWTILAFLKSDQGGLGLDIAQDNDTKRAMQLALYRLLDEDVELLKGKHLDKDYFNTLLTGGDPVRDLLIWLDQGDAFKAGRGENEWAGFVEICKSQFAFSPEKDGALVGATRLANHLGPWQPVWERYCEAPRRYPNIPNQIRKCKMPELTLYSNATSHGGWPQWNEMQEKGLRQQLLSLQKYPPHEAREKLPKIDKMYKDLRHLVWAELGESPLALALEHLTLLAEVTSNSLAVGDINDVVAIYQTSGWRADDAVLKALGCVSKDEDLEAVRGVIRTIYLPWMEEAARHLQKLADQSGYAGEPVARYKPSGGNAGECMVFVDGLRFDVAKRLANLLSTKGLNVSEKIVWTALPSVTATGKPAVTPVRHLIGGQEANSDFEPCVKETGQSLKGGHHLRKLLIDAGFTFIEKHETGDATGRGWCELGDIDTEGHDHGWKLAKHILPLMVEIVERVGQLLDAGWKTVRIVTDHGWLLLPGGLPKVDLSASLIENKWGRCAALKAGAATEERLYPWYWNPAQSFALADGISCYRNGLEYAHGGLSIQECLTLELLVTRATGGQSTRTVEITDIVWKQFRCTVAVDGDFLGLIMDIRTEPGNAASSAVVSAKPLKENGTASVVVENEELEDSQVVVVLIDQKGELVAQSATIVGGGGK
ncbi:BREX-1 system phosphatase PglZ type B [Desulforhabdus sp. TSK]|uniref:BREX-1 system phosphatase PglZ type B n=1 Tax=Desulforhabdus sp. TSK TaxID=2925014 RepID=UPI001FC7BDA2|nr:BREX-1 system phosphatase PglZ type B [Desulforhabdus sp. TSK]GKT09820.1 hypothetical protein DSTSK_31250 [Desulforhabdus sp. TSK]